jgi:hypothetical protein
MIKPMWKAFVFGMLGYVVVSFLLTISLAPPNTTFNFSGNTILNFIASAIGEYVAYFLFGFLIYSIFNRPKRKKQTGKDADVKTIAENNRT